MTERRSNKGTQAEAPSDALVFEVPPATTTTMAEKMDDLHDLRDLGLFVDRMCYLFCGIVVFSMVVISAVLMHPGVADEDKVFMVTKPVIPLFPCLMAMYAFRKERKTLLVMIMAVSMVLGYVIGYAMFSTNHSLIGAHQR